MSLLESFVAGQSKAQVDATVAAHNASIPKRADSYYDNTTAIPGVTANFTVVANRLIAVPFYVPESITIARIATTVATLAAGNCRLGAYAMLATGLPGALIATFGTIDVSGTGFKEISGLTQILSPGVLPYVFLAIESDVGPVISGFTPQRSLLGTDGGSPYGHCYVAHTYGALPDPFGTPTFATTAPRIHVRTAV